MTIRTVSAISASVVLMLFVGVSAFAQKSSANSTCVGAAFGEHAATAFLQFDQELRSAIADTSGGKFALLVNYPLRVNSGRGTYFIKDPASVAGMFDIVFPPTLRSLVSGGKEIKISCLQGGVMYGDGELWVSENAYGFRIDSINLPEASATASGGKSRIAMACRTEKYSLLVVSDKVDPAQLYLWDGARSIADKPSEVVASGIEHSEGTGSCRYTSWSFKTEHMDVEVSELGCFADSNRPPKSSIGKLSIKTAALENTWWCF